VNGNVIRIESIVWICVFALVSVLAIFFTVRAFRRRSSGKMYVATAGAVVFTAAILLIGASINVLVALTERSVIFFQGVGAIILFFLAAFTASLYTVKRWRKRSSVPFPLIVLSSVLIILACVFAGLTINFLLNQ